MWIKDVPLQISCWSPLEHVHKVLSSLELWHKVKTVTKEKKTSTCHKHEKGEKLNGFHEQVKAKAKLNILFQAGLVLHLHVSRVFDLETAIQEREKEALKQEFVFPRIY